MSIPRLHPVVEVGDTGALYSAWRVTGMNDRNSGRGVLYASFSSDPGGVLLQVYRDFERAELVASGAGAVGGRVVASPVLIGTTLSGLTVSVVVTSDAATSTVVLWVQLASEEDLREAEDDAQVFRLNDPPEVSFAKVAKRTMAQFYLLMASHYPQPQRMVDPLSYNGIESGQVSGKSGLPDRDSQDMWTLNSEGDWELTGLQNPGDYKEWAIAWSLWLLWKRKAGSADDPVYGRALGYKDEAGEQWALVRPQVDSDRDGTPSRQIRRRTPTIRRG